MTIRFEFAAVAAVTMSVGVGAAEAATYNLEKTGTSWFPVDPPVLTGMELARPGQPVKDEQSQIGGYALTGTDTVSGETWDFVAWCVDLFTPFTRNGLSPELGTYETSSEEPAGLAWYTRFDTVESLFERAWTDTILSDPILAAGWQLAIWEFLYEGPVGAGYSVTTGEFRAVEEPNYYEINGKVISSTKETEEAAWAAADDFLDQWASWRVGDPIHDFEFTYFTNTLGIGASQTLVTFTRVPTSEVPLPAPVLLLMGGLAALGALKRRAA